MLLLIFIIIIIIIVVVVCILFAWWFLIAAGRTEYLHIRYLGTRYHSHRYSGRHILKLGTRSLVVDASNTSRKLNKQKQRSNKRKRKEIQLIQMPAMDMQCVNLYRCPRRGNRAGTLSKVRVPYAAGYRWRNMVLAWFSSRCFHGNFFVISRILWNFYKFHSPCVIQYACHLCHILSNTWCFFYVLELAISILLKQKFSAKLYC